MYLSKLHLTNWRSYSDAKFEFKRPTDRKPVVLIGATEKLRSIAEWRSAIFGLVMVVILMVRPDGLAGLLGLTDRRRGRPANAVWRLLGKADSTPAADGRNP